MENPQDPTHTQDLRLQGHREVVSRYGVYSKFAEAAIDKAFPDNFTLNAELDDLDQADSDEELYLLLLLLLGEKAREIILEEDENASWFMELLGISYFRGRIVAENTLAPSSVSNPSYHAKKLRKVDEKALGTLTKNVNQMVLSINDIVKAHELTGGSVADLKKDIEKQINKAGVNAAKRTVRTELVYANQVATIFQGDLVEQETGVEVVYRWKTREDSIVRDTHKTRNNKLYSREAATPLLGEPNCRCAIHAVSNGIIPPEFNRFNIPTIEQMANS